MLLWARKKERSQPTGLLAQEPVDHQASICRDLAILANENWGLQGIELN
jgi:hypothetical protein